MDTKLIDFPPEKIVREHKISNNDGGNGGNEMLEVRVAKLESDVEYIKRAISDLKNDSRVIKSDLSLIKQYVAVLKTQVENIQTNMASKSDLFSAMHKQTVWLSGVIFIALAAGLSIAKLLL